jgi:hypothetical protein
MAASDSSEGAPDVLEQLLRKFAESGYAAAGVDPEDEHPGGHHGHGEHGSVREFEHRGHTGRIVTHYQVTIDGEPWTGQFEVLPDGSVVCHDLPQYVVPSAVDLVRAIIDQGYEAPEEVQAVLDAARESD